VADLYPIMGGRVVVNGHSGRRNTNSTCPVWAPGVDVLENFGNISPCHLGRTVLKGDEKKGKMQDKKEVRGKKKEKGERNRENKK
jgi:hypothetical protein